jgi:hypothetical protein
LATSGNEDGFLGDTLPSALNVIWLMPVTVCCYEKRRNNLDRSQPEKFRTWCPKIVTEKH